MNSEGAKKWWKEIEALKNGDLIEYRIQRGTVWSSWEECKSPGFSSNPMVQYRIKPKQVGVWVILKTYKDGLPIVWHTCKTEPEAKASCMHLNANLNAANFTYSFVLGQRPE